MCVCVCVCCNWAQPIRLTEIPGRGDPGRDGPQDGVGVADHGEGPGDGGEPLGGEPGDQTRPLDGRRGPEGSTHDRLEYTYFIYSTI